MRYRHVQVHARRLLHVRSKAHASHRQRCLHRNTTLWGAIALGQKEVCSGPCLAGTQQGRVRMPGADCAAKCFSP